MRNLILIFIFIFSTLKILTAQEKSNRLKINRVYGNVGFSVHKHAQSGIYIHLFNHLTIAGNFLTSSIKVAEYKGGLLSSSSKLYDEFNSKNLLVGITTANKKKFDFDFLFGLSEMKGKVNHSIILYQDPFSASHKYYKSTVEYFSEYGFATRLDINYNFHQFFGLNLSFQNVYTDKHSELSIALGVSFGLVQNRIRK